VKSRILAKTSINLGTERVLLLLLAMLLIGTNMLENYLCIPHNLCYQISSWPNMDQHAACPNSDRERERVRLPCLPWLQVIWDWIFYHTCCIPERARMKMATCRHGLAAALGAVYLLVSSSRYSKYQSTLQSIRTPRANAMRDAPRRPKGGIARARICGTTCLYSLGVHIILRYLALAQSNWGPF